MTRLVVGKNVLITGASRGLGRELACAFWREGANLLLAARSEAGLLSLKSELSSASDGSQAAHVVTADLASDGVARVVEAAHKVWDRVDVLINNAAILGPIGRVWQNDWQQWEMTIRVDLLAPIELCRAVVPWMIERAGGRIINLSGGGATSPRPYFSAYATAKAGLVRFSETLAEEARDANIQVNCIAPGVMNTAMLREISRAGEAAAGAEYTRAVEAMAKTDTLPSRATDLCLFLASPASPGITGKLISAVWDPWENLASHADELKNSDIYTLRRIVPKDRGGDWSG